MHPGHLYLMKAPVLCTPLQTPSELSHPSLRTFAGPRLLPPGSLPMSLVGPWNIFDRIRSSCLSSNQGLLLGVLLHSRLGHVERLLDVLLGGGREVGVIERADGLRLDGRRGRSRARGLGAGGLVALEQLLSLGGVVSHVLLGNLSGLGGVSASNLPELLGLGGDNVLCVLNVVVDQLLVRGVDQRHGEQEGSREKRETPVWNDLNEPVGEEGAEGNLQREALVGSCKMTTQKEVR